MLSYFTSLSQTISPMLNWLQTHIDSSYPLHSRVHPLNHFPKGAQWFVKRDDELSFGISGSKYRKYASLIPYLKKQGYTKVHLVGSANSNHLVGILQLLNEHALTPIVYILKPHREELKGNYGFIKLLLGDCPLHFLSREEWPNREALIRKKLSPSCIYIPEGADMFPSLPGALSLPQDISSNSSFLNISFDHLFIDAGTGLSAIALLLGMASFKLRGMAHVIMMAEENAFEKKLFAYKGLLEKECSSVVMLPKYAVYPSSIAKSFGSINQAIFNEIKSLAKEEGILCDPIYSAKLFYSAKDIYRTHSLKGNLLCIHSGGALSLCGFQEQLL